MRLTIGELWGDERWGPPGVRRLSAPDQKLEPERRLLLAQDDVQDPAAILNEVPRTTRATAAVSGPSSPLYCLS